MAVNLLPQASEAELKKTDSTLRGLVIVVLWIGIMLAIFVMLFFSRGIENGTVKELETKKMLTLNKISGLGQLQDDYYTLAYKTTVLSQIRTQQYLPSALGIYIDRKAGDTAKILSYYFDAEGTIRVNMESDSYLSAVRLWHSLLEDKTVMTELNLSSFSQDTKTKKVQFQLQGKLNLTELYAKNGQ